MKYKYYGTAAAEGIPALWCECRVCREAREKGGRNIMSRSQQLIDDTLLIDFSADNFMHTTMGLPLRKIKTCIVTHNHEDHFYPYDLNMRYADLAYFIGEEFPFNLYITKPGADHFRRVHPQYLDDRTPDRVHIHEITPYEPFEAEGYKITPLKAAHDPNAGAVIYLIEKDGKCVLHANDTGYFLDETWEYLEKNPVHIDYASFDCTETGRFLDNNKTSGHMNLPTVLNVKSRLEKIGMIDEKTICTLNHFSHNGQHTYDEIAEIGKQNGFLVSYDGFEVEF